MRRAITGCVVVSLFLASGLIAQQRRQQDIDLQAAIRTETVDGDLQGAITQFNAIVSKYGKTDRAVAASALLHVAECYQKLGNAQAQTVYAQIVRDFTDQPEAVAVASAHLGASAAGGMTARKVWNADTYGGVSPDGRYLSFVAPATFRRIATDNVRPSALAVRDLRTGSNREIEHDATLGPEQSVISRDGKLIIYTVFNYNESRYQLRLANVEGNPSPRLLFDDPDVDYLEAYDWSPDNRSVVVLVKRKDRTAQIGFVSIPDGSLRILKSVDWRGTGRIYFTPDGKYLGYHLPASEAIREHDVFVSSVDGSREITAVAHPSLNAMMGWSPDGKWLLFASNRTGANALWAVPFGDGTVQGPPELIRSHMGPVESLGVTRSGVFYYGVRFSAQPTSTIQIASLEPGTGRVVSATRIPKESSASDARPVWSLDGKFLAYISNRVGHVLVIRSSETNQVVHEFELDLSAGNGRVKRWTADGNALLITGVDGKGRPGVFRVDAHTGQASIVGIVEANQSNGEWADGNWHASADATSKYIRRDLDRPDCPPTCTTAVIYRRDLVSGVQTELIRGDQLGNVNLSPNDEYIATTVTDPATKSRTFILISTNGGRPRELMRVPANQGLAYHAWSPDSQFVLIREHLNGKPIAVWRASLDGTPPRKLDWSEDQITGRDFAINSDGTRIAYVPPAPQNTPLSEVWMLENFLPANKSK